MLSKQQIWSKNWSQSLSGRKNIRIKTWKLRGVIHTDWDNLYELYLKILIHELLLKILK